MRLSFLRLQNFRQHADTYIEFQPGLTGIIGPNGAGKSTILEAIAWAVYGSSAARGTNDTLRFVRAGARSRVAVELGFELGGHAYRVVRTPSQAEAERAVQRLDDRVAQLDNEDVKRAAGTLRDKLREVQQAAQNSDPAGAQRAAAEARDAARAAAETCGVPVDQFLGG